MLRCLFATDGAAKIFATLGAIVFFSSFDQAVAQPSDATLLSQFCDVRSIKGRTCSNAKDYQYGKICDLTLSNERYAGRFLQPTSSILIVGYQSGCEPHASNWGGAVVFESRGLTHAFRGYLPGYAPHDCVVIRRDAQQDRLVCVTGHMGQGHLESAISEFVFSRDFSNKPKLTIDVLKSAESNSGAYGAEKIDCKANHALILIGFSSLRAGPEPNTISVEASYADKAAIDKACSSKGRPPKEAISSAGDGEAYLDARAIKDGRFVLVLLSRDFLTEAEFRQTPASNKVAAADSAVASSSGQSWADPFEFCRAVKMLDSSDGRYVGPREIPSMRQAFDATKDASGEISWRCMDGSVYACWAPNGPICGKLKAVVTAAIRKYCSENPNDELVPTTHAGREPVVWACKRGVPYISGGDLRVDKRGYPVENWKLISKTAR